MCYATDRESSPPMRIAWVLAAVCTNSGRGGLGEGLGECIGGRQAKGMGLLSPSMRSHTVHGGQHMMEWSEPQMEWIELQI